MKTSPRVAVLLSLWLSVTVLGVAAPAPVATPPYFAAYRASAAPPVAGCLLQPGDRLAICGDSITEQKMYSRIMETYLTVCTPQLGVTVRQFGWSGERAPGFLARMDSDVLRFDPTVATTCYGMNDHRYQPYQAEFGRVYEESSRAILRRFQEHDVRVVQGSPGTVGKIPHWVQAARGTVADLNLSLLQLRNIDVRLATELNLRFADVYLPMLREGLRAKLRYGDDYCLSGKDGVHPGWAGHLVMAYAFLTALGLDGDIGTVTVDLAAGRASASAGHRVTTVRGDTVTVESRRWPFCAEGPLDRDDSIRSGMGLVPFNKALNRFRLIVRNAPAAAYDVTWGQTTRRYRTAALQAGVNLAADFAANPFSEAFRRVDEAVAAKQAYETRQIKTLFHGPEGKVDLDAVVARSETVHAAKARAVAQAFGPVQHAIRIVPVTP